MLPQRLSSIHSKVRQIHIQLHPAPAASSGPTSTTTTPAADSSSSAAHQRKQQPHMIGGMGPFEKLAAKLAGKPALRCCLRKQLFFAQCLKLLALFAVAICHVLFLHPFLELFTQLDDYVARVDIALRQMSSQQQQAAEAYSSASSSMNSLSAGGGGGIHHLLRLSVDDLADYKKNVWMTLAILCVALSTSSFFLFLLPSSTSPTTTIRKRYIYLIGLVDAISFGSLPFLFYARAALVQHVREGLGRALEQAHRISSAEKLMNEAQCSIQPREKMPFCSDMIVRSVFPVDLLKFLMVLCAMTLAYLLVAYLIYWCIKHWIPHNHNSRGKSSKMCCHYCARYASSSSPGHNKKVLASYTPLAQSVRPLMLLPNPLMAMPSPPAQCSPATTSIAMDEEMIPVDPPTTTAATTTTTNVAAIV